ncbi:MAG: DUF1194 domain-containing protein [Alphaproteobacteria bacterium]
MGTPHRFRAFVLGGILLLAGQPAVTRASEAVDLELALAVDVSGSIDEEEAMLQREGYIAAFHHPRVIQAVRSGYLGRIAVAYYEWAGFGHMKIIAGWTLVNDSASARAFASKLTEGPPETARRTAISEAIIFAVPFFDRNDFDGARRVIDISGDGPNNWGPLVTDARDAAVAAGATINGLPIINGRPSRWGGPSMPNLDLYYQDCVIGGPGAFIVVANEFKDFASAILRKLILEIAGEVPAGPVTAGSGTTRQSTYPVTPGHRVGAQPHRAPSVFGTSSVRPRPAAFRIAPPCDAGERQMEDYEDF